MIVGALAYVSSTCFSTSLQKNAARLAMKRLRTMFDRPKRLCVCGMWANKYSVHVIDISSVDELGYTSRSTTSGRSEA